MDFGFTLKPEQDLQRNADLARRAESNGFPTAGFSTAMFSSRSRTSS